MAKLTMCMGLPASGKSTWAKGEVEKGHTIHPVVRVNKDEIRARLGEPWSRKLEEKVVDLRDTMIKATLKAGYDVISDDTNFAPIHETRLRELARVCKADFETNFSFLEVPLLECVKRDHYREKGKVGEKVIVDMAEKYLVPSNLIERNEVNGKQLFLDLDGVLADFDGFIERELGIVNNRENEDPHFWDKARAYKGRLYFEMDPLPHAKELYDELKQFKPIILTGCPWSIPTANTDKREWIAKYIDPKAQVICCKSRNKRLYARPGDIILDDWDKYKDIWEEKGGVFIHFKGDIKASIDETKRRLGVN